jgi:hypothetical protein
MQTTRVNRLNCTGTLQPYGGLNRWVARLISGWDCRVDIFARNIWTVIQHDTGLSCVLFNPVLNRQEARKYKRLEH